MFPLHQQPRALNLPRMTFFATAYILPVAWFVYATRDPASVALAQRRAERRAAWVAGGRVD